MRRSLTPPAVVSPEARVAETLEVREVRPANWYFQASPETHNVELREWKTGTALGFDRHVATHAKGHPNSHANCHTDAYKSGRQFLETVILTVTLTSNCVRNHSTFLSIFFGIPPRSPAFPPGSSEITGSYEFQGFPTHFSGLFPELSGVFTVPK